MSVKSGEKGFYFIRHGETNGHRQGLILGCRSDLPLNSTGINQAKAAAKKLKKEKLLIERIITSSMTRAIQTADILHDAIGARMVATPDLRERDFGEWDGQRASEYPHFWEPACQPPGGESPETFEKRVSDVVTEILLMPGLVLVVGHGFMGRQMQWVLGMEPVFAEMCVLLHFIGRVKNAG